MMVRRDHLIGFKYGFVYVFQLGAHNHAHAKHVLSYMVCVHMYVKLIHANVLYRRGGGFKYDLVDPRASDTKTGNL